MSDAKSHEMQERKMLKVLFPTYFLCIEGHFRAFDTSLHNDNTGFSWKKKKVDVIKRKYIF